MAGFDLPRLAELDDAAIAQFREQGFRVVERVLDADRMAELRNRLPKLFVGQFETGVYPYEWYWREGMRLPGVSRQMANAWKADLSVARLALSADLGRAAARLSQDTIWWKAPQTKPIAHHQDTSFTDFLDPPGMVTCRVILDDTHRAAGTLEYAPGSGSNTTGDPRAIGFHLLSEGAPFSDRPGGYIYCRYQRTDDPSLDESFFPVLWSRSGARTGWIEAYCATGRRTASQARA